MELDKEKVEAIKNYCFKVRRFGGVYNLKEKQDREYYYHNINEIIKTYSKQEENSDESIFYKEQFEGLKKDLFDGFGPYINLKEDHDKVILRLNKEIKTYGLKKLIVKVNKENFFNDKYYNEETLIIEEFILVPKLLKLNAGFFDIYMIRNEDYKKLFKLAIFDFATYHEDMIDCYKVCLYLYPDIVPKISEDLFNELLEVAREKEELYWESRKRDKE